MGRRTQERRHSATKSRDSSSSFPSDFEFNVTHKSAAALCPADELFYKGQLLPLHLSPRLSMVRTILLSSPSSSSSDTPTTTAPRDSTASHASDFSSTDDSHHLDSDSSRPSSVTDGEAAAAAAVSSCNFDQSVPRKSSKCFSKFSSVFRKEPKITAADLPDGSTTPEKRSSSGAKEVIRKYLKKVKPLYEKISRTHQKMSPDPPPSTLPPPARITNSAQNKTLCMAREKRHQFADRRKWYKEKASAANQASQSFSGNLRFPGGRICPSSIESSTADGKDGGVYGFWQAQMLGRGGLVAGYTYTDTTSTEELQSAIQGAIAHCKNSMLLNKTSYETKI